MTVSIISWALCAKYFVYIISSNLTQTSEVGIIITSF